MTRLYLNSPLKEREVLTLDGDHSHHIVNVLRKKTGELVRVFNQTNGEWHANIKEISKKQVLLEILGQKSKPLKSPDLWLAFAPLKQDETNLLLEKSTELGVTHLQPLWMERSNTQRLNCNRWQRIITGAAEQCERHDLPQILPPTNIKDFLGSLSTNTTTPIKWFVALERSDQKISAAEESLSSLNLISTLINNKNNTWGFIIGPEGGFSPRERVLISATKQLTPISLGKYILRAETAAIASLAVAASCKVY